MTIALDTGLLPISPSGSPAPGWGGYALTDPADSELAFPSLLDPAAPPEARPGTAATATLVRPDQIEDGLPAAPAVPDRADQVTTNRVARWHAGPAARFDSLGMFGRAGLSRNQPEAVSLAAIQELPASPSAAAPAGRSAPPSIDTAASAAPTELAPAAVAYALAHVGFALHAERADGSSPSMPTDVLGGQVVEEVVEETGAVARVRVALDPREGAPQPNLTTFLENGTLEVTIRAGGVPAEEAGDLHRLIKQVAEERGMRLGALTVNGKRVAMPDQGGTHGCRAG